MACLFARFLEKMQYCFIPLVTLLALEKLVPANLVDRTVQQAGKHRNREQPQKTLEKQQKQKTHPMSQPIIDLY